MQSINYNLWIANGIMLTNINIHMYSAYQNDHMIIIWGIQTHIKLYDFFPCRFWYHSFFLNTKLISILLSLLGEWIIRGRDDSQKAWGVKSLCRAVRKRMCYRAMSMLGGYAFIICDRNLACFISVPLTLSVGIHILRWGRIFFCSGINQKSCWRLRRNDIGIHCFQEECYELQGWLA